MTTSSRRRRWALGAALGVATLAAGAGAALADTGPVQLSINSSGGYVACQTGLPAAEEVAISRAIQGTRHPYRHAIYTSGGSLIGSPSGLISHDLFDYLLDGASNMSVHRIDNQAAVSGNGLYECQTDSL